MWSLMSGIHEKSSITSLWSSPILASTFWHRRLWIQIHGVSIVDIIICMKSIVNEKKRQWQFLFNWWKNEQDKIKTTKNNKLLLSTDRNKDLPSKIVLASNFKDTFVITIYMRVTGNIPLQGWVIILKSCIWENDAYEPCFIIKLNNYASMMKCLFHNTARPLWGLPVIMPQLLSKALINAAYLYSSGMAVHNQITFIGC